MTRTRRRQSSRLYAFADGEVIERVAQWLRTDPGRHEHAGLQHDEQAHGLADLLEVLAAGVAELNRAVRCKPCSRAEYCSASRWNHRESGGHGAGEPRGSLRPWAWNVR